MPVCDGARSGNGSDTAGAGRPSAGEGFAAARAARDLVLDDREVSPGQGVDMALEGERPVLGRPLAYVVEPVGELFGRHPIGFVQDYVLPDVDAPRIVLIAARRAPDRSVVLVHRRRHGDRRREPHPAGDVVEQPVADPHRFDAPAVAALQALDREAVLTGLAEVVGRADDHPELRRPGAAGLALPPRPARFGRPLGLGRRLLVVGHEPKVTCRSRRPGAWGPGLAAPGAAR